MTCASRVATALVWVATLCADAVATGAWLPNGTPVSQAPGRQDSPCVAPDGAGGAYIAWDQAGDIFVTRIAGDGTPRPGWPTGGRRACASVAARPFIGCAADPDGGVILVWVDRLAMEFKGVALTAGGAVAPGWSADGNVLLRHVRGSSNSVVMPAETIGMLPADDGGFWLMYMIYEYNDCHDCSHFNNVYCRYVAQPADPPPAALQVAGGTLSRAGIWDIYWKLDERGGLLSGVEYGGLTQFSDISGPATALSWQVLALTPRLPSGLLATDIAGDGTGGMYLANSAPTYPGTFPIKLRRLGAMGGTAVGWADSGLTVHTSTSDVVPLLIPGEAGGAIVAWHTWDGGSSVRARRVDSLGTLHAGWPAAGIIVRELAGSYANHLGGLSDGAGGVYFLWQDNRPGAAGLYMSHILASGEPALLTAPNGTPFCVTPGGQGPPAVARTGPDAVIVAWSDTRSGEGEADIYAQRLPLDAGVPAMISLADVETRFDAVILRWRFAADAAAGPEVERARDGGPWEGIGPPMVDGPDHIHFEDLDVRPGERLYYRLRWTENGGVRRSGQVEVVVPQRPSLRLAGFDPNPATGTPRVSFSLEGGAPAKLEAFDMAGRRIFSQDVSHLGPGRHALSVPRNGSWGPGIYLLRLSEGARALTIRGVVLS